MDKNQNHTDRLFAEPAQPGDFVFDARVVRVFDDMINRSVPGYRTILAMVGVLANRYCQSGSRIYDLGCSLGGASFAIASAVEGHDYEIFALDNSPAMIERLRDKVNAADLPIPIHCACEDILTCDIENASVVILNFTLQFIPPPRRDELMQRVYSGMREGGILVVSEKILLPDAQLNELMIELHHRFKADMGYSELEISQKRAALENVLQPEALSRHRERLTAAGFRSLDVWFQCFNFASMVAFK